MDDPAEPTPTAGMSPTLSHTADFMEVETSSDGMDVVTDVLDEISQLAPVDATNSRLISSRQITFRSLGC